MRTFALLLCAGLLSSDVRGGDWPQFLGPNRDSHSGEKGLVTRLPKSGPPVVWEKKAGEGYSGPVVAGGRLILFHRLGDKEVVQCLDALSGKERWKSPYATDYRDALGKGDGPRSTPLISGDRVYTLSADGKLHCWNFKNGNRVWMRHLSKDYGAPQGYFGVSTSPIVEGDLVVVNVGGRKAGIVALNKDNGKEVWTATDHKRSYASPVAATIGETRHLFFFTRRGLVSLNPKNGKVRFDRRWRARIDASVNATSPVVIGEHIFVSTSYSTGAFVAKVGDKALTDLWKNDESLSAHYSACAYDNGYIYGFDGRQEEGARLRCIDWKTGKVQWNKANFGCGSLIVADAQLIVLTENGDLVLIEASPKGYREKGRATVLPGVCRAHIALAQGRLYARDGGKLVCLDLRKK